VDFRHAFPWVFCSLELRISMFAYKHEETKIRSPEKRPMTVTVPRFKMCFQNSLAR